MFEDSVIQEPVWYFTQKQRVTFNASESLKNYGAFVFNNRLGAFQAYLDLRDPFSSTSLDAPDVALLVRKALDGGHDGFIATILNTGETLYGVFMEEQIARV